MKKADGGRDEKNKEKIDQSYELWNKAKDTTFYALFMARGLESPSLTVEWLSYADEVKKSGTDYFDQTLILGTHAAYNEPNYLIRAKVTVPGLECRTDGRFDYDNGSKLESSEHVRKVKIVQKIKHEGRVNRARSMVQNASIIATKTVKPEVYVFDYENHSDELPPDGGSFDPDLRLRGHDMGGYGLSWNQCEEGHLLSGSNQICLWDINATPNNNAIDAITVIRGCYVKDVAWHPGRADVFGSVGNDKCLRVWDSRVSSISPPSQSVVAHQSKVTCLDFCRFDEWLIVTGSSDKMVKLFDMRRIDTAIHTFDYHNDAVSRVQWNLIDKNVLASSGVDRKLMVWDLRSIGKGHSPGRVSDTPPELLFRHDAHAGEVNDFSWNFLKSGCLASVDGDNKLHIWRLIDLNKLACQPKVQSLAVS